MIPRVMDEPHIREAHLIAKVFKRHLIINVYKPEGDSMIRVIKIHPILLEGNRASEFIGEVFKPLHRS